MRWPVTLGLAGYTARDRILARLSFYYETLLWISKLCQSVSYHISIWQKQKRYRTVSFYSSCTWITLFIVGGTGMIPGVYFSTSCTVAWLKCFLPSLPWELFTRVVIVIPVSWESWSLSATLPIHSQFLKSSRQEQREWCSLIWIVHRIQGLSLYRGDQGRN